MTRRQPSHLYRGYRTAGIRLNEEMIRLDDPPSDAVFAEMVDAIHWFDKAHLVMLGEEGLIEQPATTAMLRALREMEPDVLSTRRDVGGGTHSGENYLIRQLGEDIGGQLHLGRSSGDLAEIGVRVTMRRYLLDFLEKSSALRRIAIELAGEHEATVMPGYTHGQHAQPTTYGHWLAMWAQVLARDWSRACELYERVNLSPAGAAILTGSDFPLNRHRVAALMGFTAPLPNTLDAIHSHDLQLEYISTLAVHANNMARLSDDVMLWSSSEFGFLDAPDRFCSTSSIMMQKKNPQAPQATKAIAAVATGAVTTACLGFKGATGLPILERGYIENQLWTVSAGVCRSLGWWIDLLPAMRVDAERMRQLAGAHWAQATDLAGALVRERAMSWRTAHQIVGILVRLAEERGVTPDQVTPEMLDEAAVEYHGTPVELSRESLALALDAGRFPLRRTLFGGPAPGALRRELAGDRAQLAADEATRARMQAQVDGAAAQLEQTVDALLQT